MREANSKELQPDYLDWRLEGAAWVLDKILRNHPIDLRRDDVLGCYKQTYDELKQSPHPDNQSSTPDSFLKQLGVRIKVERVVRGLTQAQVAEVLGHTHAAVSDIERGITNLTVKDLQKIAYLYKIPMVKLIPGAEL